MHDEHGERAVAVGGGMAGPGDAFHVVIPSIPGCGPSGPAYQLGRDTGRVVQAWTELVRSLGCTRYIAQVGDWARRSRCGSAPKWLTATAGSSAQLYGMRWPWRG
jgi:hypothetical protein